MSYIFNLSLSQGKFIQHYKHAKVISIFKGNKLLAANYRPISLLPCFSKLLEKVVYNRLISFLTISQQQISSKQFGFRHGHSTSHALTILINKITDAFKSKQYIVLIVL